MIWKMNPYGIVRKLQQKCVSTDLWINMILTQIWLKAMNVNAFNLIKLQKEIVNSKT